MSNSRQSNDKGRIKLLFCAYRLPQKVKLKGVITTAIMVLIAVRLTAKATFPRANDVIKLEILPPGQAATSIIPNATPTVMCSPKAMINKKVAAGALPPLGSIPCQQLTWMLEQAVKMMGLNV
ncbi:MAG: hypothetical protein R2822_26560 [Spirosomataceae bacterium]